MNKRERELVHRIEREINRRQNEARKVAVIDEGFP
jgi:hypothetical protein